MEILAAIYDWAIAKKGQALALATMAVSLIASIADVLETGSVFFGGQSDRAARIELQKLLEDTGADRASLSIFESGDRIIIASSNVAGVEPIPRSNQITSLEDPGYQALFLNHIRSEACFVYRPHLPPANYLDIGMSKVKSSVLYSCPTHQPNSRVLKGAIAISFGEIPKDEKAVIQRLRQAVLAVEGLGK